MGRTTKKSKTKSTKSSSPSSSSSKPTATLKQTIEAHLINSASFIASQDYVEAKSECLKAVELATTDEGLMLRDSLEILGTVELELGEFDQAREHFLSSIQINSKLLSSSSSSSTDEITTSAAPHLYLAQLSSTPQESIQHFTNALKIINDKLSRIEVVKRDDRRTKAENDDEEEDEEDEEEIELRRSASRALVGMTELYLTDLCFEPEAEQKCEEYLLRASEIDPTDPEVYQTLASVRLSQERPTEALLAVSQGYDLWKTLSAESSAYPPNSSRLNSAKLFSELSKFEIALEILRGLEMEDDEDLEVWYLMGWCWWLLGIERDQDPDDATRKLETEFGAGAEAENGEEEERESKDECWSEAKLCLENYIKLNQRDPSESDPEQLAHVQELLGKLEEAGVVASAEREEEGEDDWQDDDDDDDDEDEEEDEEDGDVEMHE